MNKKELEKIAEFFNKQKGQKYPCSNQIVRCAVITQDRDKALSIMQDKGASLTMQGKNCLEWEFNGEKWRWDSYYGYSRRGYRFYKVILDKDINLTDDEFQFSVLARCANYCCSFEIV